MIRLMKWGIILTLVTVVALASFVGGGALGFSMGYSARRAAEHQFLEKIFNVLQEGNMDKARSSLQKYLKKQKSKAQRQWEDKRPGFLEELQDRWF